MITNGRPPRALALLVPLGILAGSHAPAAEEWPRGAVVERVFCLEAPKISYALYLPTGYVPDRPAPVLYALDARGRARHVIERFREAADRFSWVLVSSHDSRSDGPVEPTLDAFREMWVDTHARLRLDDRRAYVTGFSGGARMAVLLAHAAPGALAGVIGVGAGFPPGEEPKRGQSFAFFGAVGETDFNWSEMQRLEEALAATGATHRIVDFEGRHEWPPPAVCADAVAWMEVVGMKEGRRPRDAALVDAAYARDLETAAALLAAGRTLDAWRRYEAAGRDFAGLREVTEARTGADRLRDARAVRDLRRTRQKNLEREVRALEQARQALAADGQEESSAALGSLLARMDVPGLKRRAAGPDYEERRFAERVLELMASQTGFYLPRDLMARGDLTRARRALQVAHEIQPDNPSVWYMLARVSARQGRAEEALGWLGKVAGASLLDRARTESEADFASLRGREAFGALIGR